MNTNQLITSNTHHKPNCKPSLIDLILTKTPDLISNIKHNPPLAKSHHDVITAKIKTDHNLKCNNKSIKNVKIIKPNFDKADFSAINSYFSDVDWEVLLNGKDIDDKWSAIKHHILKAQELFVPNKIINNNKSKTNHVAMDDTLHYLLKEKRFIFKKYKKYKTKSLLYKYNHARNLVSSKIKLMKKDKENKIAKNIKKNPKAFYQYIASKTVFKEGVYELINEDGLITYVDEEKCNILNKFFSSVFTKEDSSNIPNFDFNDNIPSLDNCFITVSDMENALNNLNPNKSPGPDNIHPKLLKNASKSLASPLKALFDHSLLEGSIPSEWKCAEIRPIFKKGDKTQPGNYRPVS